MTTRESFLILHNIRSAQNVGAIFRTADAAGISKVYLTGYTPAPIDRFGRADSGISKTALDAEKNILWEKRENISPLIKKLKKSGVQVIAVEQAVGAVDYKKVRLKNRVAFIFGNEVDGLPAKILAKCDVVAEIPMRGKKESLNVAVSAGVAIFRMLRI